MFAALRQIDETIFLLRHNESLLLSEQTARKNPYLLIISLISRKWFLNSAIY